ncbi:MAG: hypothetical protein CMM01_04305 [Rhodopirellula sp.]|nr:hypothetical protein [Rhodopirellula sp.]
MAFEGFVFYLAISCIVVPIGFAWRFRSGCCASSQQRIASCRQSHHQLTESGTKLHRLLKA